jgi:two-component system, OmpR family, response regulator
MSAMAPKTPATHADDARASRALRVLVADDERDAAVSLALLLQMEGYEVREVYRGDAVLYMVRDFRPDAILLDIGMPGMSGYEVAREIKELYGQDAPLLVAVTGWSGPSDKILAKLVGFHYHVAKPYTAEQIFALLAPLSRAIASA